MSVIDDYLAERPEGQRRALGRVRRVARAVVPEAEEVIAYGMPTLRHQGRYLIHFAGFTNHMSLFPGTIRFTEGEPVADSVVEGIVRTRLAEIARER